MGKSIGGPFFDSQCNTICLTNKSVLEDLQQCFATCLSHVHETTALHVFFAGLTDFIMHKYAQIWRP